MFSTSFERSITYLFGDRSPRHVLLWSYVILAQSNPISYCTEANGCILFWLAVFHSLTHRTFLDRHCLGILFSNKAFPRRVLGLAWRGDPAKKSGICQKRQPGTGVNLNSLFITLRTETMERIPLRMGILNLLHEILHAFGASHDPKGVLPFALVLCIIIIKLSIK